jgi:DNA-binding transcriptional LysR family regulator
MRYAILFMNAARSAPSFAGMSGGGAPWRFRRGSKRARDESVGGQSFGPDGRGAARHSAYLAAKGEPRGIGDLARHNCIGFRLAASGGIYAWELLDNGEDVSVRVTGTTLVNDPTYAKELALAGVGIAYVFEPLVRKEIRDGTLRWTLPQAAIDEPGLFLYFPRRAAEAPKLRAFIQVAREVLRPEGAP